MGLASTLLCFCINIMNKPHLSVQKDLNDNTFDIVMFDMFCFVILFLHCSFKSWNLLDIGQFHMVSLKMMYRLHTQQNARVLLYRV